MKNKEYNIIRDLQKDDQACLKDLFLRYYKHLLNYSIGITKNQNVSEDIVQELFLKLWDKRKNLVINTSVKAYLFKSAYNASINYIRHQKIEIKAIQVFKEQNPGIIIPDNYEPDLKEKIYQAIEKLPKKCKEIFILNKIQAYKYKEIARELSISERTVEVQVRKANIRLRKELKIYQELIRDSK